ncbi:hypothetical protein JOQ06_019180 [Pogonophryne albipinna]|uniref:Uncharacterized protein n=1 Tax=Pogonophryne albipinna TaxID=1090488 RepID=A0AAD6ASS6_9TELE|nr:hypothetical protein JOQ06_019180 [Pogonophryne albipinna]
MASFVWDYLFCLLPSLLLLLLSLGLRWPSVCCWTRLAVSAAGWRLWVLICLILELPLDRNIRTGTEDILSGSGPASDAPQLICKPSALATYLLRHCGSLARPRLAPWPRGDPHLQTLSSLLWGQHGDTLQFTRDNLLLRDGGIVALDWAVGTRLARLTEFGDPADLEQVVAYVHSRHPSSVMVAVSEGSGSGTLRNLGESGSSSCLKAAAAISPVLRGQLWFETAMPPVYRWGALIHRKLQLSGYESSLRGVLDVDRALSCSSLRDFEETLSCSRPPKTSLNSGPDSPRVLAPSVAWALGERAYPAKDWDNYWERNEPLRDTDEVGVPVLCICSQDDPLLPPASTLPLPLFQSNPYFLLVVTDRGGHCGFTLEGPEETEGGRTGKEEEEEEGGNWSHIAVLEYFRVVADFLKGEEKDGEYIQAGQRSRTSNMAPPRRRRANVMRRQRLQPTEERSGDEEEGNFTWKRSNTR